jgi:hypothetical protein
MFSRWTKKIAESLKPVQTRLTTSRESDRIPLYHSFQSFQSTRHLQGEKWLLTGFRDNKIRNVATVAIREINSRYGATQDYAVFRNQVGAVATSLGKEYKPSATVVKVFSVDEKNSGVPNVGPNSSNDKSGVRQESAITNNSAKADEFRPLAPDSKD